MGTYHPQRFARRSLERRTDVRYHNTHDELHEIVHDEDINPWPHPFIIIPRSHSSMASMEKRSLPETPSTCESQDARGTLV